MVNGRTPTPLHKKARPYGEYGRAIQNIAADRATAVDVLRSCLFVERIPEEVLIIFGVVDGGNGRFVGGFHSTRTQTLHDGIIQQCGFLLWPIKEQREFV